MFPVCVHLGRPFLDPVRARAVGLVEGRDLMVVKIALGFVPWVGGALAEVVGHLNNDLARRQEFWMVQVSEAISTLQKRSGLTVEELMKNEAFTSFLLQATPIALRSHQNRRQKSQH